MKQFFLFLIMLMSASFLGANAQTHVMPANEARCLVVYYTYSGVTETLAQAIAEDCGGTLLQVVDHGGYPRPESSTTYNYANNERSQIDAGNWPEIGTAVDDFNQWDAVIVCTPLWNGKMANPMLTFLHNHADKLAGKQVSLAVTSWSSGISGVVTDAHNQLPNSVFVGNPLHINYGNRGNIPTMASEWVSTLEFEVSASASGRFRVIVGDKEFPATLADGETGQAFAEMLPLTLEMSELNGNEKYHYLSDVLPTDERNPGTINAGDIMLYGNSCVVLFYKTFNTSYRYTPIGHIDDHTGLAEALGASSVVVKFDRMSLPGDLNGDYEVNISDVMVLINYILNSVSGGEHPDNFSNYDVNGDKEVTVSDVMELINMILNNR